jgi:hypothetical protein
VCWQQGDEQTAVYGSSAREKNYVPQTDSNPADPTRRPLSGGAFGRRREYFSDADAFRDPCLRLLLSLNLKQLYELLFLLLLQVATLMMGSSSSSSNTAGSTVAQQQHSGTAATQRHSSNTFSSRLQTATTHR